MVWMDHFCVDNGVGMSFLCRDNGVDGSFLCRQWCGYDFYVEQMMGMGHFCVETIVWAGLCRANDVDGSFLCRDCGGVGHRCTERRLFVIVPAATTALRKGTG